MDTLAVQLTLPTTKRVVDFHHQVVAHAGRTRKSPGLSGQTGRAILFKLDTNENRSRIQSGEGFCSGARSASEGVATDRKSVV